MGTRNNRNSFRSSEKLCHRTDSVTATEVVVAVCVWKVLFSFAYSHQGDIYAIAGQQMLGTTLHTLEVSLILRLSMVYFNAVSVTPSGYCR
jgi:hypothetical protein